MLQEPIEGIFSNTFPDFSVFLRQWSEEHDEIMQVDNVLVRIDLIQKFLLSLSDLFVV